MTEVGSTGRSTRPFRAAVGRGALLLLAISVIVIAWQWGGRTGLVGRYYVNTAWVGAPALVALGDTPSTQTLSKRAAQLGGRRFAVEWTGFINVERSDSYTFTLTSDDGAWIFLDDRLIATTGQAPTAATQSETVALFSGPHSIRVRVLDKGHGGRLEVRWASAVDPPAALTTALFPTRLAYHVRQALPPRGYLIPGAWALFLLGVILAWPIRFVGRHVRAHPAEWLANAALLGVLALSVVLSAWGISWGLPDSVGWSIDEFKPVYILSFLAGQPSLDPPLHQYLLSLLFLPFQVAARLGLTDVASPHTYAALFF